MAATLCTRTLHDALPISSPATRPGCGASAPAMSGRRAISARWRAGMGRRAEIARRPDIAGAEAPRSEEHTSELQSRFDLVCRLLLEKKKSKLTSVSYSHS